MRRAPIALTSAVAVVAVACSGGVEPATPTPVVVAEPVTFEAAGLEPPATPQAQVSPNPELSPVPEPSPSPGSGESGDQSAAGSQLGPTSADAAAFVASSPSDDLRGREHVVVDLDGDTWNEVVTTGVRDGVAVVCVAWWTSAGYELLAADEAGRGRDVTDLRASDINRDGTMELLVKVEGDGRASLSLWAVPGRGRLVPLAAQGGCHDGSHVYGVTGAWLEARSDGPPAIVATCDDSPLPVADWSEQRWLWEDGAYRHHPAPPNDPPGRAKGLDDDDDDDIDDDDDDSDDGSRDTD